MAETITFRVGERERQKLQLLRSLTKLDSSKILRRLIDAVEVKTGEGQKNSDATGQGQHVAISQ